MATTLNDRSVLAEWLPRCHQILDLEAIEETILQTLLFAGFPKTIEALKQVRKHLPQAGPAKHIEDHAAAGTKTSRVIYGKHHGRLIEVLDELHPDLTRWMIEDGYGRILSRPGLDLQDRELAVMASLMASGMVNQYRAHIRGALLAGVDREDIIWFTNTFQCIIAADLRPDFENVTRRVLATHGKTTGE
ncbi:MAG: carboxymuconolactone decarboxylase family protein [Candidatus Marinimicrobia bacterium]|nr:carboxymuconolactone decarboxylase family protein [Candidatus Neomarinimicrobiota bacterium]